KRIAQTERPDGAIVSGRRVEKWIVGRDRSVGIDAQDLAEHVGESLRVCRGGVFAGRYVELAVWSKMDCAAVVVRSACERVQFEKDRFASGNDDVAVRSEPADAIVPWVGWHRVIDVKKI